MASDIRLSLAARNALLDAAITAKMGASGFIDIYSGSKPAGPDTAITSQVLLASCACSATFAPAASAGALVANSISNGTGSAGAAGGTTATWFRGRTSGGTAVVDGTVGVTGTDMIINNTSIATGQTVSVSSCTFGAPNA